MNENDVLFQKVTQAYSEKKIRVLLPGFRTQDLPITSSDALPLSYRRLVGAKAIKLGVTRVFQPFFFPLFYHCFFFHSTGSISHALR